METLNVDWCQNTHLKCITGHPRARNAQVPLTTHVERTNAMADHDCITTLRVCTLCSTEKSLGDFIRDVKKPLGYRFQCKTCISARARGRRRALVDARNELNPVNPIIANRRFDTRYEVDPNGCWIWTGATDRHGYGLFSINGTLRAAHRYAYARQNGAIPPELVLDHLCRNTRCVNPAHLEAVTSGENVRRGQHPNQMVVRERRCRRGHSLIEPSSVCTDKKGGRACRVCVNERWRNDYRQRKARREAR